MADVDYDVIVVGAGPAGSCAATVLARAGRSVLLLERGPFAGSKNMYGGVVYPRILDALHPQWWDEAPIQRWVTRRSTMVLTPTQALTIDFRIAGVGPAAVQRGDRLPARLRPLAGRQGRGRRRRVADVDDRRRPAARRAGAVVGVRTDRPDGDLRARVVIACDGVNSFCAKEAGLYPPTDAGHYTLGVKESIALPKEVIDERFNVREREGVDIEIVGGTGGVNGGAFVYTNLDTLAVGVVLKLPKLAAQQRRPEEIIAEVKSHPAIAPLVEGGEVKEYSAHVIPEGGVAMMPQMTGDGMLVAGDAAALCLAAGIWLEGVNFAMASGIDAGEAAGEALAAGDTSRAGLAGYERRLRDTFVLRDHRKLRRAPELVLSDRVQHLYPQLVTSVVERMFRVDNPTPKPGLRRFVATRTEAARHPLARPGQRRPRRLEVVRMTSRLIAGPRSASTT